MNKNILIFVTLLAVGLFFVKAAGAVMDINLDEPAKVMLTHGYKAEFCTVENSPNASNSAVVKGMMTDKYGYYKTLLTEPCLDTNKTDVIVGDVSIDYKKGYQGGETFFILGDTMYRSGTFMFTYYPQSGMGGTWVDVPKGIVEGLEILESDAFYKAEYRSASEAATLSPSVSLEPDTVLGYTGFIRHFSESGMEDGALIIFGDTVYRLVQINEEKNDAILLDYSSDADVTPVATGSAKPISSVFPTETVSISGAPSTAVPVIEGWRKYNVPEHGFSFQVPVGWTGTIVPGEAPVGFYGSGIQFYVMIDSMDPIPSPAANDLTEVWNGYTYKVVEGYGACSKGSTEQCRHGMSYDRIVGNKQYFFTFSADLVTQDTLDTIILPIMRSVEFH